MSVTASPIPAASRQTSNADRRPVWHPFAQMSELLAERPLAIAGGEGGWLIDTEGRRYLDGTASIWTNVHGHNDPDLNAALRRQLDRVAHSTLLGLTHPVGEELAEELVALATEGLSRVFFSDNGSGAVEVALKMSFQYWQLTGKPEKRGVIGFAGGYHGDTFGAMAAGDSAFFHERFRPWCFPCDHVPPPTCREQAGRVVEENAEESLRALAVLLKAKADRTACVILEPSVQGAAGMRLLPRGFAREVAALCRRHGVHLILDEVFVAFGRTGALCVATEEGVTPDFLCFAKGLTGGYLPLAATLAREEVFEAFLGSYESGRAFFHGHTFTGNPLAAAVALETVRKLRRLLAEGVIARRAEYFGRRLSEVFAGWPGVVEVRQRGFAAALEFAAGRTRVRAVCAEARALGVLLRPLGNCLPIVPPLCLDESELELLITRTAGAVEKVFPR